VNWSFVSELDSPDCDPSVTLMHKNVLENVRMKFSSATPVAQILQNYFIRLFLQNFLLPEVLITRMCLFMYRSMQQAMPTTAANKKIYKNQIKSW
jgi:hypothetical protein